MYLALPAQQEIEVDLFTVPVQPGDVIVLCTRSLWDEIRDSEITDSIRATPSDPAHVASVLIQTALERNDRQNVSAIVVSVREEFSQMPEPGIQLFVSPDRLHLTQA